VSLGRPFVYMYPCPKCDGEPDALAAVPWGKVPNTVPQFAPYICGLCGSLLLTNLLTDELFVIPEYGIEMLKRNEALWTEISRLQEEIRRLPKRRPVLR